MAKAKHPFHHLFLFLLTIFLAAVVVQGNKESQVQISIHDHHASTYKDGWKRLMIGSIAPICTYNECRGCKYKCIPQQVPIEGNDPINSAYYYKCLCTHG